MSEKSPEFLQLFGEAKRLEQKGSEIKNNIRKDGEMFFIVNKNGEKISYNFKSLDYRSDLDGLLIGKALDGKNYIVNPYTGKLESDGYKEIYRGKSVLKGIKVIDALMGESKEEIIDRSDKLPKATLVKRKKRYEKK